jgi:hypothetical protein
MLMKNFPIQDYDKKVKSDPVSYLLSMKDHNGDERSVRPEVIGGDEFSVRQSIENNHRKHKYTSGVLAFDDGENPKPEQIDAVCKKFLDTFLPDRAQEQVPYLFVAHRDKGNLEIHYVIAKEWMQLDGTTKAFNMAPPGKACLQMQNDFVATTNQELGFNQILRDPFSIAFSQFERLDTEESKNRRKVKNRFQSGVKDLVLKGAIQNRDDLIDFLKENGTVTRIGFDYISFKLPSQKKAIRFKGEFFKEGANYSTLIDQYKEYQKLKATGVKLTEEQYGEAKDRLDKAVADRTSFNQANFDKPKKSRSRAHLYVKDEAGRKKLVKGPNSYTPKRKRGQKPAQPVSQPASANTSTTPEKASIGPVGASQKNPVAQGRVRSSRPSTTAMGNLAGGGSPALISVQIHQLAFSMLELQVQLGGLSNLKESDLIKIDEITRKIFDIQQKIEALKAKQEQAAEAELVRNLTMMNKGQNPYHTMKM